MANILNRHELDPAMPAALIRRGRLHNIARIMAPTLLVALDGALARGDALLPHARDALRVIAGFETASGGPPRLRVLVDAGTRDPAGRLARLGIAEWFAPGPDAIAFRPVGPTDRADALVTADAYEAVAARASGMTALVLGADFADWSEAPLTIATRALPQVEANVRGAIAFFLAAARGLDVSSVEAGPKSGRYRAKARAWARLDDVRLGDLAGVHAPLPVEVDLTVGLAGRVEAITGGEPDAASRDEAVAFLASLAASGSIAPEGGSPPPGATHQVTVDEKGRRIVLRRRFSAI